MHVHQWSHLDASLIHSLTCRPQAVDSNPATNAVYVACGWHLSLNATRHNFVPRPLITSQPKQLFQSRECFYTSQRRHLSAVAVIATGVVGVDVGCGVEGSDAGSGVIGPVAASRWLACRRALSTASSRFLESSARMWAAFNMRRLYSSEMRVALYFWASFIALISSAMWGLNTLCAISTYNHDITTSCAASCLFSWHNCLITAQCVW